MRSLCNLCGLLFISLLFFGALSGCAPSATKSQRLTLARDIHRDTDAARRLSAQALPLIDQAKWNDAEAILQNALDADITYGPAHNNLGTVYMNEGNLYQAAWEFQYAAKLMPYQPQPKNNLGLALEAAGKLDDAVTCYDQALQIEPDNPDVLGNEARARIRRGDKDDKVRQLLEKLQTIDTRPQWVEWARERLAMLGPSSTQPQAIP